jgi:hypothetical protein
MILIRNQKNEMELVKTQKHGMRLMKIFILINENEIHQFLCPFHHFNAIFLIFYPLGRVNKYFICEKKVS